MEIKLVSNEEVEGVVCDDVQDEEVEELLEKIVPKMWETLDSVNGVGLAAPQVGIRKKFSIFYDPETKEKRIIFNGMYVNDGKTKLKMQEGCLSYELGKFVETKRFKQIKAIYYVWNETKKQLEKKIERAKGYRAVVFQHEMDHWLGKTIYYKRNK